MGRKKKIIPDVESSETPKSEDVLKKKSNTVTIVFKRNQFFRGRYFCVGEKTILDKETAKAYSSRKDIEII